jgi:hypothetical protein
MMMVLENAELALLEEAPKMEKCLWLLKNRKSVKREKENG